MIFQKIGLTPQFKYIFITDTDSEIVFPIRDIPLIFEYAIHAVISLLLSP